MYLRRNQSVQLTERQAYIFTAIFFATSSLVCLIAVLLSGLRPIHGELNGFSLAVIDSSHVIVKSGKHTFHGLPDTYDHSRHKDFFAFYLWNYCSGVKLGGRYIVDYCSSPSHSLYHLFEPWKLWTANIHKTGTRLYWLEHGPRLLCIPYLVTTCVTTMGIIASSSVVSSNKISQAIITISSSASLSSLITAVATQTTYSRLTQRADDEDIALVALKIGNWAYIMNWFGVICSCLALAIWLHLAAGKKIQRAPTIDTGVKSPAKASGLSSPLYVWPLVGSPLRKRPIAVDLKVVTGHGHE